MDRRNFIFKSAILASGLSLSFNVLSTYLPDNDLSGKTFKKPKLRGFIKVNYDFDKNNYFELRLPKCGGSGKLPIAVVIHGGYWRNKYSLDYMGHFCEWLRNHGVISINMEYRRVGDVGGGYPGTFTDIAKCIDSLPQKLNALEAFDIKVADFDNVIVIGHSAGGHLATWAFSRNYIPKSSPLYVSKPLPIKKAISLAGLLDLKYAKDNHLSNDAVLELINNFSFETIYKNISPMEMLPIESGEVVLFHGDKDDSVPIEISINYYKKARGKCIFHMINGAGHFDLVDPNSPYFNKISSRLLQAFQ